MERRANPKKRAVHNKGHSPDKRRKKDDAEDVDDEKHGQPDRHEIAELLREGKGEYDDDEEKHYAKSIKQLMREYLENEPPLTQSKRGNKQELTPPEVADYDKRGLKRRMDIPRGKIEKALTEWKKAPGSRHDFRRMINQVHSKAMGTGGNSVCATKHNIEQKRKRHEPLTFFDKKALQTSKLNQWKKCRDPAHPTRYSIWVCGHERKTRGGGSTWINGHCRPKGVTAAAEKKRKEKRERKAAIREEKLEAEEATETDEVESSEDEVLENKTPKKRQKPGRIEYTPPERKVVPRERKMAPDATSREIKRLEGIIRGLPVGSRARVGFEKTLHNVKHSERRIDTLEEALKKSTGRAETERIWADLLEAKGEVPPDAPELDEPSGDDVEIPEERGADDDSDEDKENSMMISDEELRRRDRDHYERKAMADAGRLQREDDEKKESEEDEIQEIEAPKRTEVKEIKAPTPKKGKISYEDWKKWTKPGASEADLKAIYAENYGPPPEPEAKAPEPTKIPTFEEFMETEKKAGRNPFAEMKKLHPSHVGGSLYQNYDALYNFKYFGQLPPPPEPHPKSARYHGHPDPAGKRWNPTPDAKSKQRPVDMGFKVQDDEEEEDKRVEHRKKKADNEYEEWEAKYLTQCYEEHKDMKPKELVMALTRRGIEANLDEYKADLLNRLCNDMMVNDSELEEPVFPRTKSAPRERKPRRGGPRTRSRLIDDEAEEEGAEGGVEEEEEAETKEDRDFIAPEDEDEEEEEEPTDEEERPKHTMVHPKARRSLTREEMDAALLDLKKRNAQRERLERRAKPVPFRRSPVQTRTAKKRRPRLRHVPLKR